MNEIKEQSIYCPYCGENISVLVDCSEEQQEYIEDCQVCCRPININVQYDANGELDVQVRHENE